LFDGLKIYFLPIILVIVFSATRPAFGWPWSTDMMYQPSIKPYEEPLPYPDLSITNKGIRVDPIIPREMFEEVTVNPVNPDEASLEKGEALFKNFCAPCHGPEGKGDGPVIKKGFYPVNLTAPPTQARTDGFIYAYIRFGGKVMMPSYRESIGEQGAWDVVNHVRKLQGKLK
jgi:S-disulfanyl-L-cysteine oxidoreductase SoxD